jgi:hypothetical protein
MLPSGAKAQVHLGNQMYELKLVPFMVLPVQVHLQGETTS